MVAIEEGSTLCNFNPPSGVNYIDVSLDVCLVHSSVKLNAVSTALKSCFETIHSVVTESC